MPKLPLKLPLKINGLYADIAELDKKQYTYDPDTMKVYCQRTDQHNLHYLEKHPNEFIGTLVRLEKPHLHMYASAIIDSDYYLVCDGKTDVITDNTISFSSPCFGSPEMEITESPSCCAVITVTAIISAWCSSVLYILVVHVL